MAWRSFVENVRAYPNSTVTLHDFDYDVEVQG
jgi:hypothetical protein